MTTNAGVGREDFPSFAYGCAENDAERTVTIYDELYGDISTRWITVDDRTAVPAEECP